MNAIPCCIVLCRPEESRNIGSVCRAMLNMACYDLRIVGHKEDYSEEQVRILSVHAAEIWETARFFEPTTEGLKDALADCSFSGGTTRRMGQKRKSWGMTPEQFAVQAAGTARGGMTAVVFGNERTGLTDEELDLCTVAVNIPSNEKFPSLNLSHAVQIMTYTLARTFDTHKRGYEPVNLQRLEDATETIGEYIERIGLYRKPGKEDNIRFLGNILSRAGLSEGELKRLEKLFERIAFVKTGCDSDK